MSTDRGAKSLIWIRDQISQKYFTQNPVTAILEITVKINEVKEFNEDDVKGLAGIDLDGKRDSVRVKVYKYISSQLKGNRIIQMNGQNVFINFTEEKDTKVHHITTDGWNDNVKSYYMKQLMPALMNEMSLRFRRWIITGNFIISRPLDYQPINEVDDEL